jgi:hypothetical protein
MSAVLSRRQALLTSVAGGSLAAMAGRRALGENCCPKSAKKASVVANGEIDLRDLAEDIVKALETPTRSPEIQRFLYFINDELPRIILDEHDDIDVFRSTKEVISATRGCRTWKIGDYNYPNQSRTHKHGTWDYRWETRSVKAEVFVEVCHPDIDDIRSDVYACIRVAATTAVIVAVVSENPAAGYAIFFPTFRECLKSKIGDRVKQVTVDLYSRNEYGCWTNHC